MVIFEWFASCSYSRNDEEKKRIAGQIAAFKRIQTKVSEIFQNHIQYEPHEKKNLGVVCCPVADWAS